VQEGLHHDFGYSGFETNPSEWISCGSGCIQEKKKPTRIQLDVPVNVPANATLGVYLHTPDSSEGIAMSNDQADTSGAGVTILYPARSSVSKSPFQDLSDFQFSFLGSLEYEIFSQCTEPKLELAELEQQEQGALVTAKIGSTGGVFDLLIRTFTSIDGVLVLFGNAMLESNPQLLCHTHQQPPVQMSCTECTRSIQLVHFGSGRTVLCGMCAHRKWASLDVKESAMRASVPFWNQIVAYEGTVHLASLSSPGDISELLVHLGESYDAGGSVAKQGALPTHIKRCIEKDDVASLWIWMQDTGAHLEDTESSSGKTALLVASKYDAPKCLLLLVNAGADVNATQDNGDTALHRASETGSEACIDLLITFSAQITAVNKKRKTAVCVAVSPDIRFNLLTEMGRQIRQSSPQLVEIPVLDKDVKKMLQEDRWDAIAKCLLSGHVSLKSREAKSGKTPLVCASKYGSKDCLLLLVAAGADSNAHDEFGRTPLHRACEKGNRDIIGLLLSAGADPMSEDGDGHIPIHFCAERPALRSELMHQLGKHILKERGSSWCSDLDALDMTLVIPGDVKIKFAKSNNGSHQTDVKRFVSLPFSSH
jgi:ankyrin repeat protein